MSDLSSRAAGLIHSSWARRCLGTAVLLARATTLHAQAAPAPSDGTVLFICEHGTVKSLLAKLLFEQYAAEKGLSMQALSRGTAVDSAVPPWMRASLANAKLDFGVWRPSALAPDDLTRAAYVVSFDLPASVSAGTRAPRAQWDGLPPASQDFAASRSAIATRVHQLVDSLVKHRKSR